MEHLPTENSLRCTPQNRGTVTYKTRNPYSPDGSDVYFMSDVPHLIKATRNCWSNSFGHSHTRALWVSDDIMLLCFIKLMVIYRRMEIISAGLILWQKPFLFWSESDSKIEERTRTFELLLKNASEFGSSGKTIASRILCQLYNIIDLFMKGAKYLCGKCFWFLRPRRDKGNREVCANVWQILRLPQCMLHISQCTCTSSKARFKTLQESRWSHIKS